MRRQNYALHSPLRPFAVVLLVASSAQAMLVTHSSSGTLFDDTYESQPVGGVPSTGFINPDGNGESWDTGGSGGGAVLTRDASSDAGLDANEGDRYVRLERTSGTLNLYGTWGQAVSTGDVTLKLAVYVPAEMPASAFDLVVDNQTGNAGAVELAKAFELNVRPDGGVYRVRRLNPTFDDYIDTTITFTPDAWHDWTVTYHMNPGGADTFDVTVDANSHLGLPVLNEISNAQRVFVRAANNGAVAYVDAQQIPEPASAALLAAGGLLLLKRWRL